MRRGHTREDYEMHKDGGRNPWSVAGICRGNDDDDEFSVADIDQEDGLGPGLVSSSKTASTIEAPSEVVPMSSTAEVDARRAANEASRRPAVRESYVCINSILSDAFDSAVLNAQASILGVHRYIWLLNRT